MESQISKSSHFSFFFQLIFKTLLWYVLIFNLSKKVNVAKTDTVHTLGWEHEQLGIMKMLYNVKQ